MDETFAKTIREFTLCQSWDMCTKKKSIEASDDACLKGQFTDFEKKPRHTTFESLLKIQEQAQIYGTSPNAAPAHTGDAAPVDPSLKKPDDHYAYLLELLEFQES